MRRCLLALLCSLYLSPPAFAGEPGMTMNLSPGSIAIPIAVDGQFPKPPLGAPTSAIPSGVCWGPCKESMYLALRTTNPSVTREDVASMSLPNTYDPDAAPGDQNRRFLDLSNPRWAVSPATLKEMLGMFHAPRLIDARSPAEDNGKSLVGAFPLHIPIATETLQAVLPDKTQIVVVFGNDAGTIAVADVAEELRRLGYANVLELREGIAGWIAANGEIVETRVSEEREASPSELLR